MNDILKQEEDSLIEDFRRMKRHIGFIHLFNPPKPDSYRDITDQLYVPPTAAEIETVVEDLIFCGHSKTDICRHMGIYPEHTKDKTKTLRKWMTDGSISYCHWQVLLALAGKKCIFNIVPEAGWTRKPVEEHDTKQK